MNVKKILPILVILGIGILAYSVHRDILLEREGAIDLRNRIVGSRLQRDGVAPYFYKWKAADNLRYYDPSNSDSLKLSNITATPFFHTILNPISDLPQRQISHIWLALQYVMLFVTSLFAYFLAGSSLQRILVIAIAILFLLTEAWRIHIGCGQIYIFIPFFSMVFYYCLSKSTSLLSAFIAGITAVILVLIRPNTIVFFLPFIFLYKNYSRRYLFLFGGTCILLVGLYFSGKNNRLFWTDYKKGILENIKIHQSANILNPYIPPESIKIDHWEGWSISQIQKDSAANHFEYHSEHGNIFVLYYHLFKKRIPLSMLNILCGACVLVLLALFAYFKRRSIANILPNIAILGICFYMISDFFSPIWRHQYNTVPWIFALLLAASVYRRENKWFYLFLGAGLLLNITNTNLIKMEHTIGEYIFMITLLLLSLTRNLQPNK